MRQSLWKSISLSAKKRSRFYFDLLLGTGIGTVCLCFVLWDLDWKRVADVFRRINPAYFILAVFLTMLSDFLRAYRWKIILDPVRPVGIVRLFRAEVLGLIANCILPIKVNELLNEAGITIAFPQRDIHIDTAQPLKVQVTSMDQGEVEPVVDDSRVAA